MPRWRIIVLATMVSATAFVTLPAIADPSVFDTPQQPHPFPPAMPMPPARSERATRIVVDKAWRLMMLETNRKRRHIYSIGLGDDPVGHKEQQGDSRTPEGRYWIDFKNSNSRFRLSLRISYPNAADRAHARKLRVRPGGDIMIHGHPNGVEWWRTMLMERDWTDGCIAVTNSEIQEIWTLVAVGTRIDIRP